MKKYIYGLIFVFNILCLWYLLTPTPQVPPLKDAIKSNLPGDTTQLKNVSAYYTNLSRTEVITFYKSYFNGPFRIQLNHPPEKAKDIIVNTLQSYYLEEFVFPFKQSIFINGYDWQKDVFTKPEKRFANKLIYNNIEYQSKITIKVFPTTTPERLVGFFSTELAIFAIFFLYKSVLKNK